MVLDEIPAHTRIRLEGVRQKFLDSLRGRSPTYDQIRALTEDLVQATGAPSSAVPLIEASLILMHKYERALARTEQTAEVKAALEGERTRIRTAMLRELAR